ncbi:MAG: folate-binding protein YgfZ [Gammaproteobacteria bacterium]|nr:folate-binding protein YgfZ [Gammaproteobacteria bacterium]
MSSAANLPLDLLGVLRVRGADARSFLQGQLSNDLQLLSAERALLAGYHNPQGRTIALLRLIELAPAEVLAVLPRELIEPVRTRLAKFVLRSKVTLSDESAGWRITGRLGAGGPLDRVQRTPETLEIILSGGRALLLAASDSPRAPCPAGAQAWEQARLAAGEPQLYRATSEQFVAQMLNLDLLGAIAFDKGCYTGQEVIARAHYRGRVKRRLQRFRTASPVTLVPGGGGRLRDGRTFRVVDALPLEAGGCEFLAVAPLPAQTEPEPADPEAEPLDAVALPLPYPLP